MDELELSEEEIEIEVEEEVEVEVDEEEEQPDDKTKEGNPPLAHRRSERKSIIIKKKVSSDIRKDILLRASISDKSKQNLINPNKSNKKLNEFILEENNTNQIKEADENNLNEDKIEIQNNNISERKKKSEEEEIYIQKMKNIVKSDEIENLLESKKWEEKKEGFTKLNGFIEKYSDAKTNLDTFVNYIKHKLNNFKETNFNIMKEGIRCLSSIFNKINHKENPNKTYLETIITGLNEKIADSKLKDAYIILLDSLMNSYSEKEVIDFLLSLLDKCKKVSVLKEYAEYIDKIIEDKLFIVDLNIKGIIDFLINLCNNSNPQLRNISSKVICHLYKYIGEDLKLLIKKIKGSTLKNIYEEMNKIKVDKTRSSLKLNNSNNINANSLIKPSDISKLITPKLLKEINKGSWQEKKDGLNYIAKVIKDSNNKILPDGLNNLFDLIQEKLSDGNKNFVRIIIHTLSLLITSLGNNIKIYSKLFIKPLLLNLSDKNESLRKECIDCVNKLIKNQNFEIVAYALPQLENIENSDMRSEILNLLTKNINSLLNDNYSDSFFKELISLLLNFLQDKNSKIRSKTETFIIKFKDKLKKKDYLKQMDKFKPSIIGNLKNIFNRILPDNEEKPLKKSSISDNSNNVNSHIKKIDIKKSKVNNVPNNFKKDMLLNDSKGLNKSQILNNNKTTRNLKSKNNSRKKLVDNDDKMMNKTMSNWTRKKNILKNSTLKPNNSFIKSSSKKNITQKPKFKLSFDKSNSKKDDSILSQEKLVTEPNRKVHKLSNEKTSFNKKDVYIKKIPSKKNTYVSTLKKSNNQKIGSSLNNSFTKEKIKKSSRRIVSKNESHMSLNKTEIKKEKKLNLNSINKEELIKVLNVLLNNEKEIISSILTVHNLIYNNYDVNKKVLIQNSDIIFQTFIDLIQKLFSSTKSDKKIIKYVTNVLCKISGIKELIYSISLETHINLIKIVFFFVSYEERNRLEEDEEGIVIWKSFNSIMLHIIDYCNSSQNICILIQLIKTNIVQDKIKLVEYGSRCLGIISQTIKDIYKQLNISHIFKEIHLLLIQYEVTHPDLIVNNMKEKGLIDSITSLVTELVKAKKDNIMQDYDNCAKDFQKPDKYIKKWINAELDKIKEEQMKKENELQLLIDDDISDFMSEELLINF
mgnify:CR=1 FL=1